MCTVQMGRTLGGTNQARNVKIFLASPEPSNLIEEIQAKPDMPVWRRDEKDEKEDRSYSLIITRAGRDTIAIKSEDTEDHANDVDRHTDVTATSHRRSKSITASSDNKKATAKSSANTNATPITRVGSKLALIVKMLGRTHGVSIDELTRATDWLPHTARAVTTSLRNKGCRVETKRNQDKKTVLLDRRWLIDRLRLEDTTHNKVGAILDSTSALTKKLVSASGSEQRDILFRLLNNVTIAESELRIAILTNALMTAFSFSENAQGLQFGPKKTGSQAALISKSKSDEEIVTMSSPVAFKRRGVVTKIILEGELSSKRSRPDPALIKTIARAHVWFEDIVAGRLTMTELAAREGMKVSSVAKLLPLAFLAPDIAEAILAGDQSATIVARHLIRADLPVLWTQRRAEILA